MWLRIRRGCGIFRRNSGEEDLVIPGRCNASNPESRDSGSGANAPSRNDGSGSPRRRDRALDLAKPNAVAVALAPAAHDKRIAIFRERPLDAAGQFDRLGVGPGGFVRAAALIFLGSVD